jgi:hypothetical protein
MKEELKLYFKYSQKYSHLCESELNKCFDDIDRLFHIYEVYDGKSYEINTSGFGLNNRNQNMNAWKKVSQRPVDNKNYLVCWLYADGKYSGAHRAYFRKEEGKFFSLETMDSHPLVVDLYIECPEPPTKE